MVVDMMVLVDSLQKHLLKEQHEEIVHLKKEVKHMGAEITSLIAKVVQRRDNRAIRTCGIERRIDVKASRTGKVGRRRCRIAARTDIVWKRRLPQKEQDEVAAPLEELKKLMTELPVRNAAVKPITNIPCYSTMIMQAYSITTNNWPTIIHDHISEIIQIASTGIGRALNILSN